MVDDYVASAPAPVGTATDRQGSPDLPPRRRFLPSRTAKRDFVVDVSSVLGMPLGAIPLPVQEAVAEMAEEVDRLREELAQVHQHETWIEERSDHHPVLPVAHRRAFLRQLTRLLEQSERASLPGSLLYLHVGGVELLRVVHGLAAADAALLAVAARLHAELRQTDLIGYLDGGDFAIALAVAEDDAVEEKVSRIAAQVTGQPFIWNGHDFLFTAGGGVASFRSGDTAEGLLAAADAARRGITR